MQQRNISISLPSTGDEEWEATRGPLTSGWLTQGPRVAEFENDYGPHHDQTAAYTGVIPSMLNKIDANEAPLTNGDGSQSYDFVSVEDAARCNVLALQAEIANEVFNVGTGVQTTIRELCDLILRLRDSRLMVTHSPYSVDDSRRLVQNRIFCPKKATQDLGFTYRYDLIAGLQRLIDWRSSTK